MQTQNKRFWHYTVYQTLKQILESMEIKTAPSYVDSEVDVVWFSTNPIWEETVRKKIENTETGEMSELLSKDDLFKRGWPPVRIEVNPIKVNLHSWKYHKKYSGISKKFAIGLEKITIGWGSNPDEWWVSKQPVPLEKCLWPIEIWNGENWIDIETALKGGD